MSDKSALAWSEGDEVRVYVPAFALAVAVVAASAEELPDSPVFFLCEDLDTTHEELCGPGRGVPGSARRD